MIYVPDVSVSLDANKLTGRAMLDGKNIKADIKVDAPDLGRNMKGLAGSASGFVTIGGTLSEPVAKADLTATGLRYGDDVRLEALMLRGDISAKALWRSRRLDDAARLERRPLREPRPS